MSDDIFLPLEPAYIRYGFGLLAVGEVMTLEAPTAKDALRFRSLISGHEGYYKKKFQTRRIGETFYIKRIA